MRSPSFVMIATVVLGGCAAAAAAADPKPSDATLGLKPPAEARVLFDGEGLQGWVKEDGKTPADWPVEDDILTVDSGSIKTEKTFGDFQLHVEFNVPYMPKAKGQARQQRGLPRRHLRAPGPRLGVSPAAEEQRMRHDLQPGRALRQRVQTSAPVADLRRHLPRGQGRGWQGRQEGPRHRGPERHQDHRRRRGLPNPRRRRNQARRGRADPAPGPW